MYVYKADGRFMTPTAWTEDIRKARLFNSQEEVTKEIDKRGLLGGGSIIRVQYPYVVQRGGFLPSWVLCKAKRYLTKEDAQLRCTGKNDRVVKLSFAPIEARHLVFQRHYITMFHANGDFTLSKTPPPLSFYSIPAEAPDWTVLEGPTQRLGRARRYQ